MAAEPAIMVVTSSSHTKNTTHNHTNNHTHNNIEQQLLQRTIQSVLCHADIRTQRTAAHVLDASNNNNNEQQLEQQQQQRIIDPYAHAHDNSRNLAFCSALLKRCQQLDDEIVRKMNSNKSHRLPEHHASSSKKIDNNNNNSHHKLNLAPTTLSSLLLSKCRESGYTPLHVAVRDRNLAQILLLQTYMTSTNSSNNNLSKPSNLLLVPEPPATTTTCETTNTNNNALLLLSYQVATATDHEGLTISALLGALQRSELFKCRQHLQSRWKKSATTRRRPRSNSQLFSHPDDHEENENEQDELEYLSRRLHLLPSISDNRQDGSTPQEANDDLDHPVATTTATAVSSPKITYGCEVVTFGQAHHCAMGVVASKTSADYYRGAAAETTTETTTTTTNNKSKKVKKQPTPVVVVHPHRIPAFAQEMVGRSGGAVGLAGATHHSLVVTAAGHVYATGLGTTGRLGLGDESHSSLFARVTGALTKLKVLQVAAAENHSLCVTSCGFVFGWGSNRFGQLSGVVTTGSSSNGCLPRRVEDLKHVHCIQVAAGEKHSVALTAQGQVYVWGDNTAGQLGLGMARRTGIHKVQRVEALWNRNHGIGGGAYSPKVGIAICASEQTTLVLCQPTTGIGVLPVNSIFSWGHGNHVPSKVHLEAATAAAASSDNTTTSRQQRPINPVAIACARYHSVAITSDGHVYTWGLHADSLGTNTPKSPSGNSGHKKTNKSSAIASPQLVTGMLPENGGGVAVAVSASENHTAVVTDTGALFTWGDTYKKNVLGHAGVRWQPDPKRVPGVHRAVGVAAAKEHTILLLGASFPALPPRPTHAACTLESLAARTAAQHVDLFNAIPILIMAERTQNAFLMEYCTDFIRRNLDGVLNVAKKSALDCYLNEQLAGCVLHSNKHRDDSGRHPLVSDIVLAGNLGRPSFDREALCPVKDWLDACQVLLDTPSVSRTIELMDSSKTQMTTMMLASRAEQQELLLVRKRSRSLSFSDSYSSMLTPEARKRADSFCSDRCIELTFKMNIWSVELAQAKLACLSKEVRGVRKRLEQINKLESTAVADNASSSLTPEEQLKISRRQHLEADLLILEPAIQIVEKRLKEIFLDEKMMAVDEKKNQMEAIVKKDVLTLEEAGSSAIVRFRCDICHVTCPDKTSYELHMTGRKHRNRLSQVADEEEKNKTVSIIEERQRQILLGSVEGASRKKTPTPASSWQGEPKRCVQPKFKLPPPPHPLPDTVANPSLVNVKTPSSKGLREIMEEESRKPKSMATRKSRPLTLTIPSPAFKSLKEIMEEESRKATKSSTSKSRKSVPLQLPPGSAPALKSPPWATPVARASVASVRLPSPFPTSSSNPYSLSDFIPRPKQKAAPLFPAGWASPKAAVEKAPVEAASRVSLRDIQQQEQDFNGKQEQAHDPNTKWFVERRERADSLMEIQNETVKQREDRLFVEEQIQIEKQILQEVAAAKKVTEKPKAKPRPNKPKKQKPKKSTTGKKIDREKKETAEKPKPRQKKKGPVAKKPDDGGSPKPANAGKTITELKVT